MGIIDIVPRLNLVRCVTEFDRSRSLIIEVGFFEIHNHDTDKTIELHMASSTTLSTAMAEDVAFDDLTALNENLRNALDDWEEFEDGKPILDFRGCKLLFRGSEEDEPVDHSEVWSSWTLDISRLIARNMKQGRLVLKLDHEYGKQEFHLLTPGRAVKAKATDFLPTR
jgi:hypothetical protein